MQTRAKSCRGSRGSIESTPQVKILWVISELQSACRMHMTAYMRPQLQHINAWHSPDCINPVNNTGCAEYARLKRSGYQ
jgi:hypothetical protein